MYFLFYFLKKKLSSKEDCKFKKTQTTENIISAEQFDKSKWQESLRVTEVNEPCFHSNDNNSKHQITKVSIIYVDK